jgi:hypothetical protein
MNGAIFEMLYSGYLSGLDQYGFGSAYLGSRTAVSPDDPPAAWRSGNQADGFLDDDIVNYLIREIEAGRLNAPGDAQTGELPLYMVILPQGLYSKDHFNAAVGMHYSFDYAGAHALCAWNMQGDSLHDTSKIVSHELVEAISAQLGHGEIADDCLSTSGYVRNTMVQGYKSDQDGGSCVIPGALTRKLPPGNPLFIHEPHLVGV